MDTNGVQWDGYAMIFIVLSFIWLGVVTVVLFRMIRHYNKLAEGSSKTSLREILDSMMATNDDIKRRISTIEKDISAIQTHGALHIQKVGVVRFNPFSDTGGSQSFSLALLDAHDNGIVITSLYARTGNRWYVKEISEGRGRELALSKEEESAVRKAHV